MTWSIRAIRLGAAITTAFIAAGTPAGAQGTLGTQGFGYPQGQLSTRALGTGGAVGESDPASTINPAAIAAFANSVLFFQFEPEFRTTSVAGDSRRTNVSRFPNMMAALTLGQKWSVALSASTLADRTSATRFSGFVPVAGDSAMADLSYRIDGALTDVRAAGAYRAGKNVNLGVGLHGVTGRHRLERQLAFEARPDLVSLREDTSVAYSGFAASAGVEWRVARHFGLSGSARKGGALRSRYGDDVRGKGRVPDRAGVGLRYEGVAGAVLAARLDWAGWSAMRPLLSDSAAVRDVWDMGIGADVAGPRFRRRVVQVRAGVRMRELPFTVRNDVVRELSFAGGAGIPVASGRGIIDLGVQRSRREVGDAREKAWAISLSFGIRP